MAANRRCKRPLQLLSDSEVEYLIVGSPAVMSTRKRRSTQLLCPEIPLAAAFCHHDLG